VSGGEKPDETDRSASAEAKLGGYLFGAILAGMPFAVLAAWLELTGQAGIYRDAVVRRVEDTGPNLAGVGILTIFCFWQPIGALVGGALTLRPVERAHFRGRPAAVAWMIVTGYVLAAGYVVGFLAERVVANGRSETLHAAIEFRKKERRVRSACAQVEAKQADSNCSLEKRLQEERRKQFDPRWWPDLRPEEKRL